MSTYRLSDNDVARFHADGFLIVPDLFDAELMSLLLKTGKADRQMTGAGAMKDVAGRESKIRLRMDLPDDLYAAVVHSEKIVGPLEQVLGGEVYHLHHKMMVKEPRVGGAWEWHQDYGYWYSDGYLFPDLASCSVAVDRAHKGNGCLQVLRGSHKMGRVAHGRFGQQTGADPERVQAAMERFELVHVELEPGAAVFFHCNLLHSSAPNTSPDPRWSLICCYNAARNQPVRPSHAPYAHLEKWDDERLKQVGRRHWAEMEAAGVAGAA